MILFLDPGHGGKDRGCTAAGFEEAADVFAVADLVAKMLASSEWPVTLVPSRGDDITHVGLDVRAMKATEVNADLVISLHVDDSPDPTEYGPDAMRVSQDALTDVVIGGFLGSLARPGYGVDPQGRGHVIPMCSVGQVHIASPDPTDWRHRAWNVLHWHNRPAVLFEQARCSNPTELAWLLTLESRVRRADAVVAAVCAALIHRGEIKAA